MRTPSLRKHVSGKARVTLNGKDFLLGAYGSPESIQAYHQLLAEWEASGRSPLFRSNTNETTIAEIAAAYIQHCSVYYGTGPNSELYRVKPAVEAIIELYGSTVAVSFTTLQFKALRVHLMNAPRERSRTYINRLMQSVRRMFKWAASESICPGSIYHDLSAVDPLKRGRTTAHENRPINAVPVGKVNATIPHLSPVVAAMVEFQRLTGCRPGEVCQLAPRMIDRSGDVWVITLENHKTAHHGKDRIIYVGPKAQLVLKPYLLRDENLPCFSPRESEAIRRANASANRVTPLSCGNKPGSNRVSKPGRPPGIQYNTVSYDRAVKNGCRKAFPAPEGLDAKEIKAWEKLNHWSPNQLRHSLATEVRRHDSKKGLEAASVLLGHADLETTQIYAEADRELAIEMIKKIG